MISITTVESAKRVPFDLDGRILLSRKAVELVHLTLQPGDSLPSHVNDFDVAIFVTEGSGVIESGKQSVKATVGTMAEIPAGAERGMKNTGNVPFRVLVLKLF